MNQDSGVARSDCGVSALLLAAWIWAAGTCATGCGGSAEETCGSCSGSCTSGRCLFTVVPSGAAHFGYFGDFAVDASNAYFGGYDDASVFHIEKVSLRGGAPIEVAASDTSSMRISVDSANVYWSNSSGVMKAPIAGGPSTLLASDIYAWDVVANAGSVYYAGKDGIKRVSVDGGTPETLATLESSIATGVVRIALADGTVYWNDFNVLTHVGRVMRLEPNGTPEQLASTSTTTRGIAVYGNDVFWANNPDASGPIISQVPSTGGTPTTLVSSTSAPANLAVDASGVYWEDGYTVFHLPLGGGSPSVLASWGLGASAASGMAVGPTGVFWINGDGALMALTPK